MSGNAKPSSGSSGSPYPQLLLVGALGLAVFCTLCIAGSGLDRASRRRRRVAEHTADSVQQQVHDQHEASTQVDWTPFAAKTHELWSAALNGDTMAVTRLVINGAVPPNTCHPVTSAQLVLDIAAVSVPVSLPPPCGDSQAISSAPSATGHGVLNSAAPLLNKDSRLRRVLVALSCAGWEMSVRDPTTGANALHILASQPPPQLVAERLDYFVRLQQARPLLRNMLTAVTEAGQRPEDCAAADRGDLASSLRAVRLEIAAEVASAAADAAGASSGAASAGSASEDDYSIGSYMLVERNDESDIPQPYAGDV